MQQTQNTQGGTYQNMQASAVPPMPQRVSAETADDEMTIDLGELFGVLWHWAGLIVLIALVFGIAAFSFSKFVLQEEFQSTTKIYVLDKENGSGQTTYTDLQVGSQLTKDYAELITSRTVIEKVIADNHLENVYDYSSFLGKVSVDTPTDTRIVSITVTDHDPALAQKLANDIRVEASDLIINTMQIDAVNTYEEANLPTKKSGPSCSKWTALGALVGALLVSVIVVLQYLLDDTVKTSEDVERYLGLSTLALVPLDENVGGGEKKKNKKKKKNYEPQEHGHDHGPQERAMRHEPDSYPDQNELAGQEEEPERRPQPRRERRDLQQDAVQGRSERGQQEAPQGRTGRGRQARTAEKPERTMQASNEQAGEHGKARRFGQAPQQKQNLQQPRRPQETPVQPAADEYDDMDVEDFLTDEELHEGDFDYGMDDVSSDER